MTPTPRRRAPKTPPKVQVKVWLTVQGHARLLALAARWGMNNSTAVDLILRDRARAERISVPGDV